MRERKRKPNEEERKRRWRGGRRGLERKLYKKGKNKKGERKKKA